MQCISASSVEATWEQKLVTVILLNPVFMPELFSVLGEPLNCQCPFSHLPLLSPATLLQFPVLGYVLYVFVIVIIFSLPNLLLGDSSLNIFCF